MAALQTSFGIALVHVLGGRTFQHGGQKSIWGGVLEVKDAGGPAPPRSLVEADRAPLCIILQNTRRVRSCVIFSLPGKHAISKCSLQMLERKEEQYATDPITLLPFNVTHWGNVGRIMDKVDQCMHYSNSTHTAILIMRYKIHLLPTLSFHLLTYHVR